jgi:WAS protein family homolog 1
MKPYNVPVIPPDLRHEEMIQQMCDALAYLDQVANDIFTRISHRVSENRDRLGHLNSRILVAEAKVNRIKGIIVLNCEIITM